MTPEDLEHELNKGLFSEVSRSIEENVGFHISPSEVLVFFYSVLLLVLLCIAFYVTICSRGKVRIKNNPATSGRFAGRHEVVSELAIPGKAGLYASIGSIGSAAIYIFVLITYHFIYHEFLTSWSLAVLSAGASFGLTYLYMEETRFVEKKVSAENFFQIGSFWGRRIGLDKKRRYEGILIPGPPGSGKTSGFLIGNIINDSLSNCSVFCIDVKPDEDIVEIAGHAWRVRGKKVVNFDPYKWKMHFNPLMMIETDMLSQRTHEAVREIINSLFGSYFAAVGEMQPDTDHFIGREFRLMRVVMLAVLKLPPEFRNLPTVLDVIKLAPDELARVIAYTGDKRLIEEFRFFMESTLQEKVNALQGLYRKLQFLDGPVLREALVRNDFDMEIFFREPCLFTVKAEIQRDDMRVMSGMIARLLMLRVYEKADEAKKKGVNPRTVWFYLDEFARLNLPKADEFAATGRSSRAGLTICVQDKSDIDAAMRKMKTGSPQSFLSSLRTIIVLPGCSYEMCREISSWLGKTSFNSPMKSRGVFEFLTFRFYEKAEEAPLITADNIHYMEKDKCLVLAGGIRPFFAKKLPYYKDRKYRHLLKKPVEFYMPESLQEIQKRKISDLLEERASDIQTCAGKTNELNDGVTVGTARGRKTAVYANGTDLELCFKGEAKFPLDSL